MVLPIAEPPGVRIVPAAGRFHTDLGWLDSWHCFSFGEHYDPTNQGHGLLIVSNDDIIAAGGGFGTHGHRDMEILTWVLEGSLEHRDSEGNHGIITPGLAQRMSAGTGIRHSEMNASRDEPCRLVQMWVLPDTTAIAPGYQEADLSASLMAGGLVAVAAGSGDAPIQIQQAAATLFVGRLAAGETVATPAAPHVHGFVALGSVALDHGTGTTTLEPGDAFRLTGAPELQLSALTAAEVLVWSMA